VQFLATRQKLLKYNAKHHAGVTSLSYSQNTGTEFAPGLTTVTVTATDAASNTSTATFTVTVSDTTAPVLTVPEGMIVVSTSASGAVVEFTPTATDDASTPIIVSTPASGTLFPMGDTTVNVTATDAEGLVSSGSFTVSVKAFAAGRYSGLAIPTVSSTTPGDQVGAITLSVKSSGAFTGKLKLGGENKAVSLRGVVGVDGAVLFGKAPVTSSLSIVRANKPTLELMLILFNKLTGTLDEPGQPIVSEIEAERFLYTAKKTPVAPLVNVPVSLLNPATDKGKYTVLLQAKTPAEQGLDASAFPQGNGWAKLTVAKTGIAKAVGKLVDGTPFTCAQPLSPANEWPLYVAIYKGKGSISGVVSFRDVTEQNDADGLDLRWFKPASLTDKTYRDGWGMDGILTDLYASKFVPPAIGSGQSALLLPGNVAPTIAKNATLELNDGGFSDLVSLDVSISDKSKVSFILPTSLEKPKVTINSKTGGITGSFIHPVSLKRTAFSGVIFQKQQYGSGYFLGAPASGSVATAESGGVTLAP